MAILSCDYYSLARKGIQSFAAILPVDLPPDAAGTVRYSGGPYRTIYLLHGFSGNRGDWLRRTDIEDWANQWGYAVIMPDGANSFYLDNDDAGQNTGAFIGEELVDVTRRMFHLSNRREDTVIAGLSMGGFGAIRNGLKYASTFGAVLALSSALITDEVAAMQPGIGNAIMPYSYYRHTFGEPAKLPGSDRDPKQLAKDCMGKGEIPRIFLACGSEDFLYKQNEDFHAYLDRIAYPHAWWVQAGAHTWDFWNRAMPAGIQWLEAQA
jgi:putative tributyrin esterase